MAKKEPTKEERQMIDTIDFFESLLVNNSIDRARSYMINLIFALQIGYNAVTNYSTMDMYKMVSDTGAKLKQPLVFLNRESQRRLTYLANCYDWTKTDVRFLEDFCENTLKWNQTVKEVDNEKEGQVPRDLQKMVLQYIWGIGD